VSGYLLVFTAAVLWSLIGIFSKGVLQAGVAPLEIAFWRAAIAGVFFLVHAMVAGRLRVASSSDAVSFMGFALFGVTVFYASLVLAIDTGGISLAFILLYSAPAFVVLAAWLLLGEALTPLKLALVTLALCGIVLVSQDAGTGITVSTASLFWGLLSGLSYASYYIFGKWVLRRYAPVTIYALVLPIGALGLLPFVTFTPKPLHVWGLLLLLASVSTYLAYLVYYLGLQRVEASRAVLVATIEPVVAGALAALVFGERFGPFGLLGGLFVLLASVLSALPTRRGTRQTSPS
jgi:DME family drug/metabolite transporter